MHRNTSSFLYMCCYIIPHLIEQLDRFSSPGTDCGPNQSAAQAAVIFSSAAATGGKDTSTVEMMPMSEYASAQKGSASGSLRTYASCH